MLVSHSMDASRTAAATPSNAIVNPRYEQLQNNKSQNVFIKPFIPSQPGPNSPRGKHLLYCKTPGHVIKECRKLIYRNAMNNNAQAVENRNSGNAASILVLEGVRRDAS
ncbi:hypothetical protein P5V15_005888 [Pogonomyrmex californicus]